MGDDGVEFLRRFERNRSASFCFSLLPLLSKKKERILLYRPGRGHPWIFYPDYW